MQRRDFLKASAATLAAGPIILGADKKAGTNTPTVGIDGHTYECHHNWGTLPNTLEWQTTHNVALDSQGHVYITHQGHADKKGLDCVLVFDLAGQFVKSFGKAWHGGGHGVDVRKEGGEEFFYYTNTWKSPKVVKTNAKGEVVWQLERPEAKEYADPKKAYNPTNVAFCPNGDLFVGDGYGSNYLLKYDKDGKMLSVFGGAGTADGQFRTPHGNWIDERVKDKPALVVCDRANARLQTFDLAGKHLATTAKGTVLFPANIDIRGDTMLVPDLHARVSLFDKAGKPIVHLGEDPAWRGRVVSSLDKGKGPAVRSQPKEWPAGKFVHPHDACFDPAGNIFVVEWVDGGRITFLKKV